MKKIKGFTLIELMITVAIIGILSAIAYPAYQDQIRKSRRADAQAVLLNIAGRQQQFLLDTRSYAASLSDLGVTVPASTSSFYAVTVAVTNSATAPPSFTVTATPQGGQTADKCDSPNTAILTVNQAGTKAPATCW